MSIAPPTKSSTETIFENLGSEIKDGFDKFGVVLENSLSSVLQVTIVTQDASNNVLYRTVIDVQGNATNTFQAAEPAPNDQYWVRHNAMVDQAVQNRNQLMLKVIDTVGGIVKIIPV